MKTRARYSSDFKANLLKRFERSSQTADDFAQAHGVKPTTFKSWLYRTPASAQPDLKLIPLEPVETPVRTSEDSIEIILGDQLYVTLPTSIEPDFLAQVLLHIADR